MPLRLWVGTKERQQAFAAALQHLVDLGRVPAGLPINQFSQPIYVLGLNELVTNADSASAAQLVSWRYFAGSSTGPAAAGDVDTSSPPKVTSMRYGDVARNALDAMLRLETLDETQANSYELRILRVPGALVEAFWLKPADGNGLIVPSSRVLVEKFRTGTPYSIDSFFNDGLRQIAVDVLRRPDSPLKQDLP